ncbi:hypothetical protein C922_03088 [Plasmodium inui San Antonio 1]|uniref:Uncharacterized protein n=1 Tax=Plasmodium inui San Antonio 1 TaxID=1237626 RepID=W7ABH8_9APIC|nr:hypothetical protein C922_03088 [Plasmodium inui San Antonio 1]EUD66454.1 hypothetical protein C922_03088 [Plasmodium inui San Antonio 1]
MPKKKYALLRKILKNSHGILSSDSSESGAEGFLFSSEEENLASEDDGGDFSSPAWSSNTNSSSSAHFARRPEKINPPKRPPAQRRSNHPWWEHSQKEKKKERQRKKERQKHRRVNKCLERINDSFFNTDQSAKCALEQKKRKDKCRKGTTTTITTTKNRRDRRGHTKWSASPHPGQRNSHGGSPIPEFHADWENPLQSNFPFSSSFLGKDMPAQRESTNQGNDCWTTCLQDQPTAKCVLCVEDTQMGKIKEIILSISAVKPMCISCFFIFTNLLHYHPVVCLSCFRRQFPPDRAAICAVCACPEKGTSMGTHREQLAVAKKELEIIMSLVKYKQRHSPPSDSFLNYFVNVSYCLKHLYLYLNSHQTLIFCRNRIFARYSVPFVDLLGRLTGGAKAVSFQRDGAEGWHWRQSHQRRDGVHQCAHQKEAPPVREVKGENLEGSEQVSYSEEVRDSEEVITSEHDTHSEDVTNSDHFYPLEPSNFARDVDWEAPHFSDHAQAVGSNGGALEKEEEAHHGGGSANGKGEEEEKEVEEEKEKVKEEEEEKEVKDEDEEVEEEDEEVKEEGVKEEKEEGNESEEAQRTGEENGPKESQKTEEEDESKEAQEAGEEDKPTPAECRKDQWEEDPTEKQGQHGEEVEEEEIEEDVEMVEVQENIPCVEEARQGGVEEEPERGETPEGKSPPAGEPTTEEPLLRREVESADAPPKEPLDRITLPLEEEATRKTDIIRKIISKNEEEKKLKEDHQMEEKIAHTFSEAVIYSLLELRSGKMASSFDQLKQYDIKFKERDFNKTVKKYHTRGDLFLYYVRYVQRKEREAQRLYESLQTANKEVQTVRRRFRLNYGTTPTQTDINQEVRTKDKQLRRAQILLGNKLSGFERLSNVKEAYRIVDEVRLQLGQALNGGGAEGELRLPKGIPLAMKNFLKNGISLCREDMRKNPSRGTTNGELLHLHAKYSNFRSDVQALLKMMTLLYARFSDRNRAANEEDTKDTLNEMKMFAYDRRAKKIIRNLDNPSKMRVPIQPCKWKAVAGRVSGGTQLRCGANTRGRRGTRRRAASSSFSSSPPMVFILDIKKKNLEKFLLHNNRVEIVDKHTILYLREVYHFDHIFINHIFCNGLMSSVVCKYVEKFVGQHNVALFNFSLTCARKKKMSFLNSFADCFEVAARKASGGKPEGGLQGRLATRLEAPLHARASPKPHAQPPPARVWGKHHDSKRDCKQGRAKKGKDTNYHEGGDDKSKCPNKDVDTSPNKSQKKRIKKKGTCQDDRTNDAHGKQKGSNTREKKTILTKIINELKKKTNETYADDTYSLTLHMYAQRGVGHLYNIGRRVFSGIEEAHKLQGGAAPDGGTPPDECTPPGDEPHDPSADADGNTDTDLNTRGSHKHAAPYSLCIDLKKIGNINRLINYKEINKYKRHTIIFLIKLEFSSRQGGEIQSKGQGRSHHKRIFHFALVDINIPIFDVMKRKKNKINYLTEFRNKKNFQNIFVNYIQSYFLNNPPPMVSASNKIVKFLFRNKPHTCFFLHMDDDFLFSNTTPLSYCTANLTKKGDAQNVNQDAQHGDEEKSNNVIILQLLYIYYWCTVCECGELENVGN